ncbi:MAG TPA: beta-ketoacyl-[acyl-carrier-protein] synthase family protein [Polyangiaceae bacterium]|nr:beta-ketoacyl-[acyl-carrier-protein] synthase family protein [Polyangiaceae bacterium]
MRVFVTGLGVVSPLAVGARATMDGLVQGKSAFRPVTRFDTSDQRTHWAAEVTGATVADVAPPLHREQWSRTDAMAVIAAREALAEARIDPSRDEVHAAFGGTTGGMFETEQMLAEMHRDPSRREPHALMLSHPLSATSDRLQAAVGPFARSRTVCSACSGGANAILIGAGWIRSGRSARVLAGGADGLCRLTFTGFNALGAVAPDRCRPFDRRRAGLGLGEGAAFLVLESEDSMRARGAVPLAELAGWAVGSEAHHITNPEEAGATAARLMARALERGGVSVRELDYVNAHGTGTPLNDAMESRALHRALGAEIARVAVSSCKGQIGHTLGAAGAIEAAMTVLAIVRGELPPTGGLEVPDEACDLVHVIGQGRRAQVRAALSNSFGFGGTDTVLLFTRPGLVARSPALREAAPRPAKARSRIVITGAATLGPLGLLASRDSLRYVEPGAAPTGERLQFEAKEHFDLARARRMDRPARLLTMAMQTALGESKGERALGAELGAIAGSAYGSVDASAEFIQRIYDKGGRLASPLAFPNLVPSSPVGHAAIYLGMRGPVLATLDLGVTGEAAVALACELIEAGEAKAMLAGSVEEQSAITEHVLGPVCAGSASWTGIRSEGAAAIVLEDEDNAAARGARPLCRVAYHASGRDPFAPEAANLPAPLRAALVVVARRDAATLGALAETTWRDVPIVDVASRAGHHEGLGALCIAASVGVLGQGRAEQVLVLGVAPDRWVTFVLTRP